MSSESDVVNIEFEVLVEQWDWILIIMINCLKVKNVVNVVVSWGLVDVMDQFDGDVGLLVVILIGGGGLFCVGMDFKVFVWGENVVVEGCGFGFIECLLIKLFIVVVEGYVLVGGIELVFVVDLIVVVRDLVFGIFEVKWGLVVGGGGLLWLLECILYVIVMELVLIGDNLLVECVYELGFVNVLVELGIVFDVVIVLVEKIIVNGLLVVVVIKWIIIELCGWSFDIMFVEQMKILVLVFIFNDVKEGVIVFVERCWFCWMGIQFSYVMVQFIGSRIFFCWVKCLIFLGLFLWLILEFLQLLKGELGLKVYQLILYVLVWICCEILMFLGMLVVYMLFVSLYIELLVIVIVFFLVL